MTAPLPPWARGPFELLVHAEGHLRNGDDFDRRIALISFDNAIEVAISMYLTLEPIQRGNRSYSRANVDKWTENYHTKLDFLEIECASRKVMPPVDRAHIVWLHNQRNEQYHGGANGTPEKSDLELVRQAALWVFGVLFDVPDPEATLAQAILDRAPPVKPSHSRSFDVAIDTRYGIIIVGEQSYYASELLFAVDDAAYRDLGGRLCEPSPQAAVDGADR